VNKGKRRAEVWHPGRGCSVQYRLLCPLGALLLLRLLLLLVLRLLRLLLLLAPL
jgi:hypothetical protein